MVMGSFVLVPCAVYACSSSTNDAQPNLLDGAVDQDGNVITDPDAIAKSDTATDVDQGGSPVNTSTVSVMVAGDSRDYVLSVPKTYDASKSYPLIIALAGDGQTADQLRTSITLDSVAGNDAIIAYPDGVDDLFTDYADNGDQQLIQATADDVKSKYSIDSSKIWGFGYSKGGYMLNQLQCLRPGLFTAYAAHAAGPPADEQGNPLNCQTGTPIPILEQQGSLDTMPAPGADEAAMDWAEFYGCGTTMTAATPNVCEKYDGCPAGVQIEYCFPSGVAHVPIWDQAVNVSWSFYRGQ